MNQDEKMPVSDAEVKKLQDEVDAENKKRETLRQKVVAEFTTMCAEFLYAEFSRKLKEMDEKSQFFKSLEE